MITSDGDIEYLKTQLADAERLSRGRWHEARAAEYQAARLRRAIRDYIDLPFDAPDSERADLLQSLDDAARDGAEA